jgi:hypothetical protein
MHQFEMDPDVETSLAVIDATLAGEAVEPEHAELAELTLILAGQRPLPSVAFAAALDERVSRRFAAPAPASGGGSRRRWLYAPSAAFGLAAAVALVLVVLSAGGSGSSSGPELPVHASAGSSAGSPSAEKVAPSGQATGAASGGATTSSQPSASSSSGVSSSSSPVLSPAPSTGGRQIIQGAQLALSARPARIDSVAQQVFDVIGAQNGVVNSSNVTAANNASGYAQFELSVPSANLGQTMAALSQLRGASVLSRTDSSQDVTGALGGAGRQLSNARALRTALLRQLAIATTATEIDSLKVQIRDANASIASDLATLRSMHREVDVSNISVTINASMAPGHPVSSGGSFTIGRAAHDAGRVLVVAAGVALIALAVLVPLGMLAAAGLWLAYAIRRRRREQALDLV